MVQYLHFRILKFPLITAECYIIAVPMHISACCRHPSNEVSKNNPKLIKPTLEHPPGPLSKLSNNSYFSSPYKRTYCGWLRNPAPKGWLKPYSGMFTTYQLVMDFFHFLPSSVSVKPPMEVTLNLEIFELSAAAPAQRFFGPRPARAGGQWPRAAAGGTRETWQVVVFLLVLQRFLLRKSGNIIQNK